MLQGDGPYTTGEIATAAGVPLWRIANILKAAEVAPVRKAGPINLYNKPDAEYLISVSNRIDRDRGIVRRQPANNTFGNGIGWRCPSSQPRLSI